jgi:hypothetical protein
MNRGPGIGSPVRSLTGGRTWVRQLVYIGRACRMRCVSRRQLRARRVCRHIRRHPGCSDSITPGRGEPDRRCPRSLLRQRLSVRKRRNARMKGWRILPHARGVANGCNSKCRLGGLFASQWLNHTVRSPIHSKPAGKREAWPERISPAPQSLPAKRGVKFQ